MNLEVSRNGWRVDAKGHVDELEREFATHLNRKRKFELSAKLAGAALAVTAAVNIADKFTGFVPEQWKFLMRASPGLSVWTAINGMANAEYHDRQAVNKARLAAGLSTSNQLPVPVWTEAHLHAPETEISFTTATPGSINTEQLAA